LLKKPSIDECIDVLENIQYTQQAQLDSVPKSACGIGHKITDAQVKIAKEILSKTKIMPIIGSNFVGEICLHFVLQVESPLGHYSPYVYQIMFAKIKRNKKIEVTEIVPPKERWQREMALSCEVATVDDFMEKLSSFLEFSYNFENHNISSKKRAEITKIKEAQNEW
jgi:hypothetical protein